MNGSKNLTVYENLDTSFVNLGALLRYLQQRDFSGRVVVDMGDYRAEVRLRMAERPLCRELDTVTGREGTGEAAMQRLLVRSLDAGGRISVYGEGAEEPEDEPPAHVAEDDSHLSDEERDFQGMLRAGADLVAAIERAAQSTGANFSILFRLARMELADDYSFLDPNAGLFEYANNEIELHANPSQRAFVSGLCEALRRVVERLAQGTRATSLRERIALELAVVARRRGPQLKHFGFISQLDRIAGTRVI